MHGPFWLSSVQRARRDRWRKNEDRKKEKIAEKSNKFADNDVGGLKCFVTQCSAVRRTVEHKTSKIYFITTRVADNSYDIRL